MKKYETLSKLVKAVKSGEIDESKLVVIQDNDCSSVYNGPPEEDDNYDVINEIYAGDGYADTDDLWKALFPAADVQWC
ncbi:hypothetical protein LCGC14_1205770 [marine sediment metagenome]|uniref:Uncharacterized protein n=1 Tax=marine sediment metagenome TaxID=412755 RepID=A0A0F9M2X4_9ZZZZ